jgi:hypothetical protein
MESVLDSWTVTSYLVSVKQAFHKEALVPKRLELALRRFLEIVLVVATAAAGYAAIRGRLPAATLGAIVPGLVALSVTVDHLNRSRGQPGRCVPRPGR